MSEPLIDVVEGGSYTGQQLNALIQNLQEKISTHLPAQEFKVCLERVFLIHEIEMNCRKGPSAITCTTSGGCSGF